MTTDARALIASAKRRELTVNLCVRGDLVAEHHTLEARLDELTRDGIGAAALDPTSEAGQVAERITALEQEIRDTTATLTFRALGRRDWDALLADHAPREGSTESFNMATFPAALVAASLVDPTMTVAEVDDLYDVINEGQRDELFSAAWSVNTEATAVPFSERASVVTRWRAQNSKQPAPGASPEASSSDAS